MTLSPPQRLQRNFREGNPLGGECRFDYLSSLVPALTLYSGFIRPTKDHGSSTEGRGATERNEGAGNEP